MCISSNRNYQRITRIEAASLGLENITASVADALKNVKKVRHHPHIVVEHHYHDHANDSEEETVDERPARGGVTTPFPLRLHAMLDKLAADGYADVISWQPHGRCFVVRKPKEFKELLPKYFKLSKMASFQRQLNLYGFQRLTRGKDKNGYYHEYFLRGKPALAHQIQRTKVKGTGVRARSNPTTEPHLWEMTWVGTDQERAANVDKNSARIAEGQQRTGNDIAPISPAAAHKSAPAVVSSSNSASSLTCLPLIAPQLPSSSVVPSSPQKQPPQLSWQHYQPPVNMKQQQQQKILTPQERKYQQQLQQDEDVVVSFGGKRFHYLDPFEMMQEAQLRKKQYQACQEDDMQAFVSNLQLDSLCANMDDQTMDDDVAFISILEKIVE